MSSYTLPSTLTGRACTVIGAGTLGRRIALMWLTRGGSVHLYDTSQAQLDSAKDFIEDALPKLLESVKGERGTLKLCQDRDEALATSWIVVEAIPEILSLKVDLLGELDAVLPLDVILATNSSSFTPSELNAKVHHKDRLISTHYYMPPIVLPLEIMPTELTHTDITPFLMEQARKVGLLPYHVRKESVGLIANRIWAAIKRECLLTASQGVAEPQEIDSILQYGLGFSIPPFKSMDVVGLDVVVDIERHYQQTRPGQCPVEAEQYAQSFVEKGKLGIKTGSGFYDY